ncbi:hypothetical protein MTR67_002718 [Solanum verrucosum]|uniref:Protein-serine/threonine kinase n=1 Tax=Solanum verrucosum TaxID=315347 RepID=A0AAF0PR33_SOLVR|nr:hypothetical protein MTR67_002718 [Solanum verrucosum]
MAAKKLYESFSKELIEEVHRWGSMKQTGVSLKYMMEFGSKPTPRNLLISSQFLHKELPMRIARRVIDLQTLPYGLSHKPAVLKVRDWYLDSFRDLRSFPDIKDENDELEFTKMINLVKVRHNNVVPMMALGVQQLKKDLHPKIDYKDLDEIHQFLDRFYMSRIGIRMLIGQHVALHDPNPPPDCVGYIHTKMSPLEVARNATEDARSICLREYGSAPKISDEGGGIPRSGLPKIFTYLYSTARNPLDEHSDLDTIDLATVSTLAGYGYGLPISRLYARYFGGDLQIISMEGYGTDAYLHLSRLGDSQEPLP